jgi:UDP-2,4-diacetamido-2,4,6-trideoxy-beta-L-altropyranose hydrolase
LLFKIEKAGFKNLKVAFRVDASNLIGTGHVMRCLTLADALMNKGAACKFICRRHEGNLIHLIRQRGYQVYELTATFESLKLGKNDPFHAVWLGANWEEDSMETINVLDGEVFDWIVVDHYALNNLWEEKLRPWCNKIMVIDDLADRDHDCDFLLDQNLGSAEKKYNCLIPIHCKQLHGPEYALLNPVFAQKRSQMSARTGKVKRVLIYFGGGLDEVDLTGRALGIFKTPRLFDIEIDVVVGTAYAHRRNLEKAVTKYENINIHCQIPNLADLMVEADISIGAGGSTTWERCCMGLPTIIVVCALNQEEIGRAVNRAKAAYLVYPNENLEKNLYTFFTELYENSSSYLLMSSRASTICDGLGSERVCMELMR